MLALLAGTATIPRSDRVIGFLHDDLTRRGITGGLLMDLFARGIEGRAQACEALSSGGLLPRLRLASVFADDNSLATRVILEEGALRRLGGSGLLDRRLVPFTTLEVPVGLDEPEATDLHLGTPVVLWGADADALARFARSLARLHGMPLLRLANGAPHELTRPRRARSSI